MGYEVVKTLPPAHVVRSVHPLTPALRAQVEKHRREIKAILEGRDDRLLMIVGPCSAWPKEAFKEYAKRLRDQARQMCDSVKIVIRLYTQKPRTTLGWNGSFIQPDPRRAPDIYAGLFEARELMVEVAEMGLAIATEILFYEASEYLEDCCAWIGIGARSSENHLYRCYASGLDIPVGLKNPTHGDVGVAINTVEAAQHAHDYFASNEHRHSAGNPYAHLVLRGANKQPNVDATQLRKTLSHLQARTGMPMNFIIDASHDNCMVDGQKIPERQCDIIKDCLLLAEQDPNLKRALRGFMVESFLKAGRQSTDSPNAIDPSGLSITDPCLSWSQTQAILHEVYESRQTLQVAV